MNIRRDIDKLLITMRSIEEKKKAVDHEVEHIEETIARRNTDLLLAEAQNSRLETIFEARKRIKQISGELSRLDDDTRSAAADLDESDCVEYT